LLIRRYANLSTETYDIITVGGGLAGAALAGAMAACGFRVLVLERERKFKDRVRGEQMHPWGVAELRELGLYQPLNSMHGHELPWFDFYIGPELASHRNLVDTTPQAAPEFSFYHPAMQDLVLQVAVDAKAEVKRGVSVHSVEPGATPKVVASENGKAMEYRARLVVGADGRNSVTREKAGFRVSRDKDHKWALAGVLLDDVPIAEDTSRMAFNPKLCSAVLLFPQGQGRVRSYLAYQKDSLRMLRGNDDLSHFVAQSIRIGCPSEIFENARVAGPLATFDTTDCWVEHPYKNGVALIGDAAAVNDPCFGEGLSLTARDVRVLRDKLLQETDWDVAGNAYANEHDRYWKAMLTCTHWFAQMYYDTSPDAAERRATALRLIAQDETRMPDHIISGPDLPLDETIRKRFFGEV